MAYLHSVDELDEDPPYKLIVPSIRMAIGEEFEHVAPGAVVEDEEQVAPFVDYFM